MKYFVLLFFLSFIIFNSFGIDKSVKSISKDTVFLVQEVPNFTFRLSYIDKFGDYVIIDGIRENRIVSETAYIEIETPSFNYWLRRGDHYTLHGNYHGGFEPELEICKGNKIQNDNEAMFFAQLYHENPNLLRNRVRQEQEKEVKDNIFHIKNKERYQQKIGYLDKQKANISLLFYDLCSKLFFVEYLDGLLYLLEEKKEEDVKQILLNYKNTINWDDLLFSQTYKQFLLHYTLMLNSEFSENFLGTKEYFKEKTRDYFLFKRIKANRNKDLLTEFFNDCQDEDYKDYIKQELVAEEKIFMSKNMLLQIDLSQISLEDMLLKYKGKFVYVDICASWCTPCRKLFPLSHEWQKHFSEDIVFIYLSIDKNYRLWMNVVNSENFDKNNCYLISERSNFIIESQVKNIGIPCYIIFDRNGKLIEENAIRPDNKNFSMKINEIIAKY